MLNFSDYLSELKLTLQYHDELNSKIWKSEDKIKPEVRQALIKFAHAWAEFAKIPKSMIQDIVMTGGNANYNYTSKSDIDVHLIVDRSKLFSDPKFVEEYLQDKKSLWTLTHNVEVYGYPLEPYAQDDDIKYPKNQGVYSLKNNKWVAKPHKVDYDFQNDHLLKQKVSHYMHAIDHMIKHHMGEESFKNMKARFKSMRTASLEQYGEFGRENLVFKELRNRGYIDKMNKYETSLKDKELSLK
jgi:hypothetical protein